MIEQSCKNNTFIHWKLQLWTVIEASKWCIKSGGLYWEQTNLTFLQNEPGKSGSILCLLNIQYLCTKNSSQAETGRGTGAFARRETWRPESRLAWQPCWVHATVHQVLCEDQSEVEDEDGGCQAIIGYCYFWKLKITMKTWIACSLFMEFTISETFSYFGRLLHMTRDQVVAVCTYT